MPFPEKLLSLKLSWRLYIIERCSPIFQKKCIACSHLFPFIFRMPSFSQQRTFHPTFRIAIVPGIYSISTPEHQPSGKNCDTSIIFSATRMPLERELNLPWEYYTSFSFLSKMWLCLIILNSIQFNAR